MGGKSKTPKKTTQTTVSNPWKGAQPFIKHGLGEAFDMYRQGVGFNPYDKSMVVGHSTPTRQAMQGMLGFAGKQDMSGGLAALQGQLPRLIAESRGDFSDTFNQTLGRAQEDANTAVSMNAAAMGRYGSGIHQGNVAREIGDLTNRAMLDRQQWAQNAMMNNIGAQSGAYQSAMMPFRTQMQIGSMREDLQRRRMDDDARRFHARENAPWERLGAYYNMATAGGGLGGSSTSISRAPQAQRSRWGGVLGGALSGYGMGGWPGAIIGGLSGLF